MRERFAFQFPHATFRRYVTLPWLRLQNQVRRDRRQVAQKPAKALVPTVQVYPHRDGKREGDVETRHVVPAEIFADDGGSVMSRHDVTDAKRKRRLVMGFDGTAFDEGGVKVNAEDVELWLGTWGGSLGRILRVQRGVGFL